MTMSQPTFSVIEYSTGFGLQHNATGKVRWMGDGVDTIFAEDGTPLWPGTPGFIKAWEEALNSNEDETLEAYFGPGWE